MPNYAIRSIAESAEDEALAALFPDDEKTEPCPNVEQLVAIARKRVDELDACAPSKPTAVYYLRDKDGVLLYVGIGSGFVTRLDSHVRTKDWRLDIATATVEWHGNREQAKTAEARAISDLEPLHNVAKPLGGTSQEPMSITRLRLASLGRLSDEGKFRHCRSCRSPLPEDGNRWTCQRCATRRSRMMRAK